MTPPSDIAAALDRLTAKFDQMAERITAAFDQPERDPHQWSTRPCQTCAAVSELIGRSFGCYARPLPARG